VCFVYCVRVLTSILRVFTQGHGLTEQQKAICDGYVYIPQYGSGTASLNVSVAASIVMHHFALWAQYDERAREGEKFIVAERRQRTSKRGVIGEHPDAVRARRAAARLAARNDDRDDNVDDDGGAGENIESVIF
jgi:tRNA C32,U32 (ribose-2'-O)-methylase TrmJ